MHLVKRAVNPHCGAETANSLIVAELVQDGPQSSSHQVCRAERNNRAHMLDSDAVFMGGLNPKTCQYLFGFMQTFLAPKKREKKMELQG